MQEVRTERRKHKFRNEKFDVFKKQKRRMQQSFQFCHKKKKKFVPEAQMLTTQESQPRMDKKNICFSSVFCLETRCEESDQLRAGATGGEQRQQEANKIAANSLPTALTCTVNLIGMHKIVSQNCHQFCRVSKHSRQHPTLPLPLL
jgi:hypothetical protein